MLKDWFALKLVAKLVLLMMATVNVFSISANLNILEISPEWEYKNGEFSALAISKDGHFFAVGTKDSETLYLYNLMENVTLSWSVQIGQVHSISISHDGEDLAVGGGNEFFLFSNATSNPRIRYVVGEKPIVAMSSDGEYAVAAAKLDNGNTTLETKIHVFKNGQPTPVWTKILQGAVNGISLSRNGTYFVVSTSYPGVMYVFTAKQDNPLWSHFFGEKGGGVQISQDGETIIVVGGDSTSAVNGSYERIQRVFRFSTQNQIATYQKLVTDVPPQERLAVSSNGSIFAIGYISTNQLVFWDMNIEPYSPQSIHFIDLPATPTALSMSEDGKYTLIGTSESILVYEYTNHSYNLRAQYTANKGAVHSVDSSLNARKLIVVREESSTNNRTVISFFRNQLNLGSDTIDISIACPVDLVKIIMLTILVTFGFLFGKQLFHDLSSPV